MSRLIWVVVVICVGGAISFVVGQSLPRRWFRPDMPFFRCYAWEKGGRIYHKIGVRRWKDHLPDMSRIMPGMVKKKAALARTPENMELLIKELCVAELIHWLLIIVVSPLVGLAMGGWLSVPVAAAYALGNLAFVIIQRYNRPRLYEIYKRMEMRRKK